MLAACGSGDGAKVALAPDPDLVTPTTTPLAAEPEDEAAEQSADPLDPAQGRGGEIRGAFSLQIPKLDVDAPVVSIQNNADRVLVPPRDPTVVGWWSEGVAPGSQSGSAVLVGHSVRTGGGALNELVELGEGDTIEIKGSESSLTYKVQSVEVLSKDDLARHAEDIFNQSGPGRLVVVTCEDWDGSVWQSNVVTIATPI